MAGRRVFSGIQPTGTLHLGNYLGAVAPLVSGQESYQTIVCIADLHALTIPETVRPGDLASAVRDAAMVLMACGIDPERAILFRQSHVPAHSELAWLLGCTTPVGWLERMIQFKTRTAGLESVGTGLLAYPVLQAADILLYQADLVPVGEDQEQHLELTRHIARRFHSLFGEVFTLPGAVLRPGGARVMGLDDPSVKMSKSMGVARPRHAIGIVDSPDVIRAAIMHAVTDSGQEVRPDRVSPGVGNLLAMYGLLAGRDREEVVQEFSGKGYTFLKGALADLVVGALEPIRHRYLAIRAEPASLDAILDRGAARAGDLGRPTIERVKQLLGLGEDAAKMEIGNSTRSPP